MNREERPDQYLRWQLHFANPHLTLKAEAFPGPGHSCFFCNPNFGVQGDHV